MICNISVMYFYVGFMFCFCRELYRDHKNLQKASPLECAVCSDILLVCVAVPSLNFFQLF